MAKIRLTQKRVHELESGGAGKQAYLWDSDVAGLGVRAIGKQKYYLIQTRINRKVVQIKLGNVTLFTIDSARTEAKRLLLMINQGFDPREEKRKQLAKQEEEKNSRLKMESLKKAKGATVGEIWKRYMAERQPHWGKRHYVDHCKLSQDGTAVKLKGEGLKKPGPLAPLMAKRLDEITNEYLEEWLKNEVASRPTQSSLALSLLRSFIRWCSEQSDFKEAINPSIINTKIKSLIPKTTAKTDCLQREQLQAWFAAVIKIQNPVISVYLQALLLTGARREELAMLRWSDVDFQWNSAAIRDKVDGQRIIPLTPYVKYILNSLPRRNEWVFSSPTAASGRLQSPFVAHRNALNCAGIDHLTLHGLRRSFGTLSEWCEIPVGVVAQIQGHKPSAIAEKHYRIRPLDLLRKWHTALEKWILEEACINLPEHTTQSHRLKLNGSSTNDNEFTAI
jgi:integrase